MAPSISQHSIMTAYVTAPSPALLSHFEPPSLRPLDLGQLEGEEVFAELEKTVEDMQSWLVCVERGLEDLAV
jgi:protein-serine/threonine kinase